MCTPSLHDLMHILSIPCALTFPRVRLYTQVGGARARSEAEVHRKKSSYYEEEFDVAEAEVLAAEQMIAESRVFSTRLFHHAKAISQRAIVMEAATKDAALQVQHPERPDQLSLIRDLNEKKSEYDKTLAAVEEIENKPSHKKTPDNYADLVKRRDILKRQIKEEFNRLKRIRTTDHYECKHTHINTRTHPHKLGRVPAATKRLRRHDSRLGGSSGTSGGRNCREI